MISGKMKKKKKKNKEIKRSIKMIVYLNYCGNLSLFSRAASCGCIINQGTQKVPRGDEEEEDASYEQTPAG